VVRVAALIFVVAVAAGIAAVAFAAQSPKALRTAIFAAARHERSVHYVEAGAAKGLTQRIVGDVAATRGIQRVSFTLNGKKGRFTVLVVHRIAYLRGNAPTLAGYFGFTAAQAAQFQGQWISVPPSSKKYTDLAASVTLPSFLHDIYPGGRLSLVTSKIGGRARTGVRGTNREPGVKFMEAIFPKSSAPLLPEEVADIEPAKGFIDATKISGWNESVSVQAPAGAVPISTVQAS
jgi:hypothetical protein